MEGKIDGMCFSIEKGSELCDEAECLFLHDCDDDEVDLIFENKEAVQIAKERPQNLIIKTYTPRGGIGEYYLFDTKNQKALWE